MTRLQALIVLAGLESCGARAVVPVEDGQGGASTDAAQDGRSDTSGTSIDLSLLLGTYEGTAMGELINDPDVGGVDHGPVEFHTTYQVLPRGADSVVFVNTLSTDFTQADECFAVTPVRVEGGMLVFENMSCPADGMRLFSEHLDGVIVVQGNQLVMTLNDYRDELQLTPMGLVRMLETSHLTITLTRTSP